MTNCSWDHGQAWGKEEFEATFRICAKVAKTEKYLVGFWLSDKQEFIVRTILATLSPTAAIQRFTCHKINHFA